MAAAALRAAYSIQIGWEQYATDIFILDHSLISGTDMIAASSWSQTFSGPHDDVTADTDSFTVTRGKSDDLAQVQAGTGTLTLRDPDGRYNPANPAGPLYGSLRPQRPCRILATYGGTAYPLFYGFVRSLEYQEGPRFGQAHVELNDFFVWLDTPRSDGSGGVALPVIARMNNTTTGAAIGAILDYLNWTDTSLRSLDTGDPIPYFEAYGDKTPLQLISDLLAANGGIFYIDGMGRAVFEDRNTRWLRNSYATLNQAAEAISPGTQLDRVQNRQFAARQFETTPGDPTTVTTGTVQQADDGPSEAEFGVRAGDTVESIYFPNDGFALGMAQWRLNKTKNPDLPMYGMDVDNRDDINFRAALQAELERTITAPMTKYGDTGEFFIEQITHSVSRRDRRHQTTMLLSRRAQGDKPFVVSTDVVDSSVATIGF